jgi:hypothetical protein
MITTEHFAIQYDSTQTPNGQQLSQALLQTCEGDYATLRGIFGGVDPPAPINVTVDNGAGGRQNGHDIVHDGDAGQGAVGDFDYLRNAFVMELAELFMYAQKNKWNPGDSKGEALSRVLGGLLYPGGMQPGFTVHQWVDNLPDGLNPSEDQPTGPEGLEDWITKVDGNDTRAKSIGCGVAFIHYLHYQLGFSFSQIVGASGDTLEGVYEALTGSSGGFQPFAELVRTAFPRGRPSGLNEQAKYPDSDQFFPLRPAQPAFFPAGHLWHGVRHADGSWTGAGDAQDVLAIPDKVAAVAGTGGAAGETQFMFTTQDGHLWHSLRHADGSWTGLGDATAAIGVPGPVTAVAAADGGAGETQFMFTTQDGHLWHSLRHADGSWTGLGDATAAIGVPGTVVTVAGTGGAPGETQFMFSNSGEGLWHSLRHGDGSWTGLGDAKAALPVPAPFVDGPFGAVAAANVPAATGPSGETQFMFVAYIHLT